MMYLSETLTDLHCITGLLCYAEEQSDITDLLCYVCYRHNRSNLPLIQKEDWCQKRFLNTNWNFFYWTIVNSTLACSLRFFFGNLFLKFLWGSSWKPPSGDWRPPRKTLLLLLLLLYYWTNKFLRNRPSKFILNISKSFKKNY